ncbi:unnamed protein product [Hermetia illucens]|uniref:Uncharacterized protein n=1 Tax=Hermetia illucens TaxID=343691 RepID=A0A7R8UB36_HERIL|nr:uncharacterized protein LOC119646198 [Hermetia illucens]CAD7077439.1 unnamed protein product [Hermetia illucens]
MLLSEFIIFAFVVCGMFPVVEVLNAERVRRTTTSNILSRKRRYVAFPEGSSFTVAICLQGGVVGRPNVNFLSFAVNWGLAYDLPNETWVLANAHGFKEGDNIINNIIASDIATEAKTKRMFRRDLYKKIEIILNSLGYNGTECIMKTLCESTKALAARNANMVGRMLRTIFSFPKVRPFAREHREIHEYDLAYRTGEASDCSLLYPYCDFSILDFALGKYLLPYK